MTLLPPVPPGSSFIQFSTVPSDGRVSPRGSRFIQSSVQYSLIQHTTLYNNNKIHHSTTYHSRIHHIIAQHNTIYLPTKLTPYQNNSLHHYTKQTPLHINTSQQDSTTYHNAIQHNTQHHNITPQYNTTE